MGTQQRIEQQDLDSILNSADDLTENKVTYVTNIRLNISNNEATLDLYYLSPDPQNPGGNPKAQRVQRLVMPLGLAKNIGQILVNAMTEWEDAFGITLPIELHDEH